MANATTPPSLPLPAAAAPQRSHLPGELQVHCSPAHVLKVPYYAKSTFERFSVSTVNTSSLYEKKPALSLRLEAQPLVL